MSFPRYERYKDTGVAWLGEVPEHWKRVPFWSRFRRTKRIGYESLTLLSAYRDHGVVPKASRDDNNNKPSDDLSVYQLVEPGDLVINKMKAWQGSVAVSSHRGIVSPAYFVYIAMHFDNPQFLHYLMRSENYITGYLSISKGVRIGQWDLDPIYHSRLPLFLPPTDEQDLIASFIERQTAKIDALIEEQRRLIELLKEKRQAVISHAVTKGLNPDATMRDSGLPSHGLIPRHWSISKVCALAKIGNGSTPSRERIDYWDGGNYPWLNSSVVNQEQVEEAEQFVTETALRDCHLPKITPPAILIGITGQGRTRGMATTLRFEATINQHIAYVLPRGDTVEIDYLRRTFDMLYTELRTESEGGGSTKGAITCEQIGQVRVALPPIAEQLEIGAWVRRKNDECDGLIQEVVFAIALLQERRSALISAAVTGKIDVRGYAKQTGEAA